LDRFLKSGFILRAGGWRADSGASGSRGQIFAGNLSRERDGRHAKVLLKKFHSGKVEQIWMHQSKREAPTAETRDFSELP
jgi:hypothetical protein